MNEYIVMFHAYGDDEEQAVDKVCEALNMGGEPASVVVDDGRELYEVYAVHDPDEIADENRKERFYTARLTAQEAENLLSAMKVIGLSHPLVKKAEPQTLQEILADIETEFDDIADTHKEDR